MESNERAALICGGKSVARIDRKIIRRPVSGQCRDRGFFLGANSYLLAVAAIFRRQHELVRDLIVVAFRPAIVGAFFELDNFLSRKLRALLGGKEARPVLRELVAAMLGDEWVVTLGGIAATAVAGWRGPRGPRSGCLLLLLAALWSAWPTALAWRSYASLRWSSRWGQWSVPQIVRALRHGQAPDRALNPFAMLWANFHNFTDDDATAIATFLKTGSRPVHNPIPPKLTYGLVETIAMKFTRPLPATIPKELTYADGNFANDSTRGSPARVQTWLVDAQWMVLVLGLVLFVSAGPRPRILLAIGGILGITGVGALLYILSQWPSIRNVPPEPLVNAVNLGDVKPDTRDMPAEHARMVERGHYLYSVSCTICHGTDGSGGTPISWKPIGTLWTRNITAHSQTGVGAWTDAELKRAICSGISRDGRQLHWQGMTWDQFSNLEEEDLRAIVAYVRVLPPVNRTVLIPRPPAANDCETYTFYLEKSNQPGCR